MLPTGASRQSLCIYVRPLLVVSKTRADKRQASPTDIKPLYQSRGNSGVFFITAPEHRGPTDHRGGVGTQ